MYEQTHWNPRRIGTPPPACRRTAEPGRVRRYHRPHPGRRPPSVYRWRQAARSRPDGLAAKPHPGPKPGLSDAQLEHLEDLLLDGAVAHGWPNALWTAPRVAEVIRRHFGIGYHPEHVRKLLKGRLH